MPKKLIGVDCDLTVCPSDVGWCEWLAEKHGYVKTPMIEYDFSKYYPQCGDPYAYWRDLNYNQFQPIEGSVDTLKYLSEDFGIVFISSVKGNHNKSKYYWLQQHFPFMEGYIATKEKHLMNDSVVAMIDDRNSILAKFKETKRVRYSTKYIQDVECDVAMSFSSWDSKFLVKFYDMLFY